MGVFGVGTGALRLYLCSFLKHHLAFHHQVVGVTALACGMIAVGSCNGDVTSTIVQTIMEKNEQELKDTYARWLPLGLGLNHLGKHVWICIYNKVLRRFRALGETWGGISAAAALTVSLVTVPR